MRLGMNSYSVVITVKPYRMYKIQKKHAVIVYKYKSIELTISWTVKRHIREKTSNIHVFIQLKNITDTFIVIN